MNFKQLKESMKCLSHDNLFIFKYFFIIGIVGRGFTNNQWIKSKWNNPGKRVAHSLSSQYSSYWKESSTFVSVSHQTRLDTRAKARSPIKVGIKRRGRSGTSRDSNPAGLCCSSAHLMRCEPDEPSSFKNPNVDPGTYAGLWLELDSKV